MIRLIFALALFLSLPLALASCGDDDDDDEKNVDDPMTLEQLIEKCIEFETHCGWYEEGSCIYQPEGVCVSNEFYSDEEAACECRAQYDYYNCVIASTPENNCLDMSDCSAQWSQAHRKCWLLGE